MNDQNTLSPWIKRFLVEYLVSIKNLSRNTQHSYRDTFRQYLTYLAKKVGKHIDQLAVEDISSDNIKEFLLDLESKRQCSIATRNQRLAAIHAFAQFMGLNSPEHICDRSFDRSRKT
jgi:site-specific recombinase XerD